MTFPLASLVDPAILVGGTGGSGVLAFVVAKFRAQDREIRECRERDADVKILMAGVRVVVGKMQRDDPDSVELRMFQDLCSRRLGPPPSIDDFSDLLRQVDEADERMKRNEPNN